MMYDAVHDLPFPLSRSLAAKLRGYRWHALALFAGITLSGALFIERAMMGPQAPVMVPAASTSTCSATDFTLGIRSKSSAREVTGTAFLKNQSTKHCTLPAFATITPADAQGKTWRVRSERSGNKKQQVTVGPQQEASVRFTWDNWCNGQQEAWLKVSFDGLDGYLLAPMQDKNGKLLAPPRCRMMSRQSRFTVKSISL